jgi:hypothetical protein
MRKKKIIAKRLKTRWNVKGNGKRFVDERSEL